jgi:hypothetical protein
MGEGGEASSLVHAPSKRTKPSATLMLERMG